MNNIGKAIVVYFSATGTTKGVAERLAGAIGADIFEIVPAQPYTDADLNWRDKKSRSSVEMADRKSRPAIAKAAPNLTDYKTVFVGFPIWYYGAPNIIQTFVKAYDWTGKRIALFATSGGSDIGKTAEKLAPFLDGKGEIVAAKLFRPSVTKEDLKEWADSVLNG